MPALFTGCAGVKVQAPYLFIVHNFQDMGVPGNKQLWRVAVYLIFNMLAVPAGVAANVGYPNVYTFAIKAQVFGINGPYIFAIYITINAPQRFKCRQLICKLKRTKIAGMPDFIAVIKMFKNGIVEEAMGIRYKAYARHRANIDTTYKRQGTGGQKNNND